MPKLKVRGSWTQFLKPLRDLEPFKTHGSLKGVRHWEGPGRLTEPLHLEATADGVDYYVYSWATPIAWHHAERGWCTPNERYSVSTTQQQGRINAALSQL